MGLQPVPYGMLEIRSVGTRVCKFDPRGGKNVRVLYKDVKGGGQNHDQT